MQDTHDADQVATYPADLACPAPPARVEPRQTTPNAPVAAVNPAAVAPPAPDLRLPRRWHDTVLPAELPQMARDIGLRVRAEIAEYRWPADGEQARSIREGTEKALLTFVTQIFRTGEPHRGDRGLLPRPGPAGGDRGRHLESLHAAFRVGALIAWRRIAAAAERDPLPSETVARLADLVFSFADRLAQLAGEGFAQAHAEEFDGLHAAPGPTRAHDRRPADAVDATRSPSSRCVRAGRCRSASS